MTRQTDETGAPVDDIAQEKHLLNEARIAAERGIAMSLTNLHTQYEKQLNECWSTFHETLAGLRGRAEAQTVTRAEAAAILGLSAPRVSELIQKGRLPGRELVPGGRLAIPRSAVEALAAGRG